MAEKLVSKTEHREIVVKDGIVEARRVVTERTVQGADFLAALEKRKSVTVGPLPHNCVFYAQLPGDQGKGNSVYVLELMPHMRKVVFKRPPANADEDRDPAACVDTYNLSWPYSLWMFTFEGPSMTNIWLCAATDSVRNGGLGLPIFRMPIHNQYGEGDANFCYGNLSMDMGLPEGKRIDEAMFHLMTSMWNTELLPHFAGTGLKSLADWSDRSKNNEGFWKEIKYIRHKRQTLAGLLQGVGFNVQ